MNAKLIITSIMLSVFNMGAAFATGSQGGGYGPVTVDRLQNVPNSTTTTSPLIQGDQWTFYGRAGESVTLRIDTRDDFGNNTSGLDPVLLLKDSNDTCLVTKTIM